MREGEQNQSALERNSEKLGEQNEKTLVSNYSNYYQSINQSLFTLITNM